MKREGTKTTRVCGGGAVVVILAAVAAFLLPGGDYRIDKHAEAGRPPKLSPDYGGIRIPFNIAPMNFVIASRTSSTFPIMLSLLKK